jgi:uncharacterized membrane protein
MDEIREVYVECQNGVVMDRKTPAEPLVAFSAGVMAVITTIMVLDSKPPAQATLPAPLPSWPMARSYAVSYLFLAIIGINHHPLLLLAQDASPKLVRWNFSHLFSCLNSQTQGSRLVCQCLCGGICDG